eukprot:gnl/Trimastix_PCT/3639.p1 GENE.gnl/Trimastix_PCT/3639~~gnl/Trimastix_PCT/3639.p1  ORF type:complete len:120 (+),score=22.18 gnl/Trimastix_PCT/3639:2-361(+)
MTCSLASTNARELKMDVDLPDQEAPEFVTLRSCDDFEFIVDKKCAMVSGTIRTMLQSSFLEAKEQVIRFPDIPAVLLEQAIEYFYYKVRYTNSTEPYPPFKVHPEMALQLLMVANYLNT